MADKKENKILNLKKDKVLIGYIVDKPDSNVSELEEVSYRYDDAVACGDMFSVWYKGKIRNFIVTRIISKWAYSDSRIGMGSFDSMSHVISRIEYKKHSILKAARSRIRDINAAMIEMLESKNKNKAMDDAIKALKKSDQEEFEEARAAIEELETNPESVEL